MQTLTLDIELLGTEGGLIESIVGHSFVLSDSTTGTVVEVGFDSTMGTIFEVGSDSTTGKVVEVSYDSSTGTTVLHASLPGVSCFPDLGVVCGSSGSKAALSFLLVH
jgi:hypothetical protein